MGVHMLTRDRQAGRQKTPINAKRIFDPDEMLRNEVMSNAYTTSANYNANVGISLDPTRTHRSFNPDEMPRKDFMQSSTPTTSDTSINEKPKSADNARAEKQKQIRQRVREQYGLS